MSQSQAHAVALETLKSQLAALESAIGWKTDDLVSTNQHQVRLRLELDDLRKQRSALTDFIRVHFPSEENE
jgi:hypothetical protein